MPADQRNPLVEGAVEITLRERVLPSVPARVTPPQDGLDCALTAMRKDPDLVSSGMQNTQMPYLRAIIWGETALSQPEFFERQVSRVRQKVRGTVLAGAVIRGPNCEDCGYFNGVILTGECEGSCEAHKRHLVPVVPPPQGRSALFPFVFGGGSFQKNSLLG